MKKTFLTKRNALLSGESVSWGIVALAFAIVMLLMRLLTPNLFWYITAPAFSTAGVLTDKSHIFLSIFGDRSALTIENEQLRNENAALVSENQALVKRVGDTITSLGIVASIASRPPESPYDTLIISAGREDGVVVGMEAFGIVNAQKNIGGIPIGVVSNVMDRYSRVTLFSSPRSTLNGWVGKESVPLIIRGEGAGAFSASVARSAEINVSDIVYAPGPGMLPIGSVARIDGDLSAPSVTLRIQSSVNIFSLSLVDLRDSGRIPFIQVSATTTLP